MSKRPWKILLTGNDLEEIRLIEEALAELEELQFSREWLRPCELHLAEQTSDLLALLARERFDAVLLDLDIGAGQAAGAFARVAEQAPEVPVLLLCSNETESDAVHFVRKGAQDYLIKSELDCIPLARALRCAVERHRRHSAMRSLLFVDPAIGVYTESGFHHVATRFAQLLRGLGQQPRVFAIELDGLERLRDLYGTEERDLVLMRTAEMLRRQFEESGILGRLGPARFAVLQPDDESISPAQVDHRLRARIRSTTGHRSGGCLVGMRMGTAAGPEAVGRLLEAATQVLCENGRSLTSAGAAG